MRTRARLWPHIAVMFALAHLRVFLVGPVNAEPLAYVTIHLDGSVAVLDTASNTVVDTVAVGDRPISVAITQDGALAYVMNSVSHSVSVIDTASNTVVDTFTPGDYPYGIAIMPQQLIALDIRPAGCPNPLVLRGRARLSVAIVGSPEFDVITVDAGSIRLAGVPPVKTSFEDVATPFEPFAGKEDCSLDCHDWGPDGWMDLSLKFVSQEVAAALGTIRDGDCVVLTLMGNLREEFGGTPLRGEDVVVVVNGGRGRVGSPELASPDRTSSDLEDGARVHVQRME